MEAKEKVDKSVPKKACIITFSGYLFPPGTRLELNYMVPGACWAPSYMLYLDKNCSEAELVLRALICQQTGEDWENVNIILSTAFPQKWTDLPELASLRIGRKQQAVRKTGFREAPGGAEALYSDFDDEFGILETPVSNKEGKRKAPPPQTVSPVEGFGISNDKVSEEKIYPEEGADEVAVMSNMRIPDGMDKEAAPAPEMKKKARLEESFRRAKTSIPAKADSVSGAVELQSAKQLYGCVLPEKEEITASKKYLNFERLRMPGIDSGRRGAVMIISENKYYEDICMQYGLEYKDSFKTAFKKSISDAESVKNIKLPGGIFIAESYKGFDYAYKADAPVDIPSNSIFHNIKVVHFDSAPEPYYVTVPREDTAVFRFITMKNELEAPLLRGLCDVFTGGNYTAAGKIKFTAPKGIIRLGLGVEQRIKVARNIKYNEETSGLAGSNNKLNHSIEIELKNLTDFNIKIRICERIPVTDLKPEDIRISVTDVSPAWEKFDPEDYSLRGGYFWDIEMKPSETVTLKSDYTIIISSKYELTGGNRREE
jgi:hypothetical protein